jgi:hypothetical protein
MARRSRSEFAPGHIRIDRDRVCLEDAPASSHSRLTPYGSLDCAIFWRLSVSAGLISSSKRSRPRCECWQGKPTPCTSVSSQAKRQRVDHLPRHPSIFLGPFGSRPSADPATFWNLLFLAERPSAPSRRRFWARGVPACRSLRWGRRSEGVGQGFLVYPDPPIPLPTSCSASARPLPNNSPALSYRGPPRTSACSPVRCRNLHDNAFRARTRERTSTRSAI